MDASLPTNKRLFNDTSIFDIIPPDAVIIFENVFVPPVIPFIIN